jgi:hypothetical protein
MGEPHYTPSGYPRRNKPGSSLFMRDEFKLIETGIDKMDRYILLMEHRDAYNTDRRYITVPWDGTITRVGVVAHELVAGAALKGLFYIDTGTAPSSQIVLSDADSSDNVTLSIFVGSAAGSRRSSETASNNTVSAGDVVSCRTNNSVSAATANATSFIELARA